MKKAQKEKDPELAIIGQRIRAARKARGLTMEKLSEAGETSIQFLFQIEKGEQSMTLMKFYRLVKALGVSSDYILFGRAPAEGTAALAAEYLGGMNPIERDILARNILHLRRLLDEIAPEP